VAEWVNAKERHPEQEGRYLIYYQHKGGRIKRVFIGDFFFDPEPTWSSLLNSEVLFWMPLPEPPNENPK
jgi:hypothetical protein